MTDMTEQRNKKNLLEDVQGNADTRGIALKTAGVSKVTMPLKVLQKDARIQTVHATTDMGVFLPADQKGTHMSRFIILLNQWSQEHILTANLHTVLSAVKKELKSSQATIRFQFPFFINKKAPVTNHCAPMEHHIEIRGNMNETDTLTSVLGITFPIATLCPCSKAISDYGAHNQRAELRVKLLLDNTQITTDQTPMLWIEDVVEKLDEAASCPVYPILKRTDEKYVTERQYDNPKFVEDVVRDGSLILNELPAIQGYTIEVEALESIHGHNAFAYQEHQWPYPRY